MPPHQGPALNKPSSSDLWNNNTQTAVPALDPHCVVMGVGDWSLSTLPPLGGEEHPQHPLGQQSHPGERENVLGFVKHLVIDKNKNTKKGKKKNNYQ